jgi:hypothetical protein
VIRFLVFVAVVLLLVWAGRHYYVKWLDAQTRKREQGRR